MIRTLSLMILAATILAGCFDQHGRGDTCDCCGTTVTRAEGESCAGGICDPYCAFVGDAGPPRTVDAGPPSPPPPPPPPGCEGGEPRALDLLCPSWIPAGRATTIPVAIGGDGQCYCGESVACEVTSVTRTGTIELSTSICSEGLLCDGCFPYVEATCELPALPEGTWAVRVNGERLFDLNVSPPDVMPEWGLACQHRRGEDTLGCGTDWPPQPVEQPTETCHPRGAYPEERVTLRVTDGCASCGTIEGPCRVDVFDDVVRLSPRRVNTNCDVDCPTICMPQEHTCVTPPLPEGTWRVFVGDVPMGTRIEVGAPPATTEEVCGAPLGG